MQNPNDLIYTPTDVANLTVEQIKKLEENRAESVRLKVPGMCDELRQLRPGSLTSVIALPSNWKTGLMQSIARDTASQLDPGGNECVVFVTWEVAVEEIGVLDLGNVSKLDIADILDGNVKDWRAIEKAALARATVPIYVIGHSLARRKSRPKLTLDNVALALRAMEDERNLRPRVVLLDYLQRIERDGDSEPRLEFSKNVDRAKDMSIAAGVPVVLGCQAKQEVMQREMKLPRLNDGMETSNVMHTSDNIITLWRPLVTEGEGVEFDIFGQTLIASPDLLIAHVAKQKFGKVGGWWKLSVDFARGQVRGEMQ